MATVKTIKPGGGGDYTTLQAWENWADDQAGADQWAECYAGGDLGEVTLQTWTATPTASLYPRIYTPLAERHNGKDADVGARIEVGAANGIRDLLSFTRIEGIRIEVNSGASNAGISGAGSGGGTVYDSNLIIANHVDAKKGIDVSVSNKDATGMVMRNNIIYSNSLLDQCLVFSILGTTTSTTVDVVVHNNSFTKAFSHGYRMIETSSGATATLNLTIENNISLDGNIADFSTTITNGTVTSNNNCSTDATADDDGGSDHLISQTTADIVVAVATDVNLKAGSNALEAGKNLGATFDWDALHLDGDVWRLAPWDMGAIAPSSIVNPPGKTSNNIII